MKSYKEQIKADRKAAAAERRQSDYRNDTGYVKIYSKVAGE